MIEAVLVGAISGGCAWLIYSLVNVGLEAWDDRQERPPPLHKPPPRWWHWRT